MRAFNFLHHPALASQRRKRHRWWTSLAGLALGSAVAWWAAQLVQEAADQIHLERQRLQVQLSAQQAQWQDLQKHTAMQKKWLSQSVHLSQLQHQHATWRALHQALQKEFGPNSVQLTRLQLEGLRLEMQGIASNAQRMEVARHAMALHLAQHLQPLLVLNSLVVSPSSGSFDAVQAKVSGGVPVPHIKPSQGGALEFVWQSGWPAWSDPVGLMDVAEPLVQNVQVLP